MLRAAMNAPGKIVFVCNSCGYRARIPEHYQGMSIKCPGCGVAQVAEPAPEPAPAKAAESGTSSGKTVSITRVATTPLPFTMEQAGAPAELSSSGSGPNPLRTPLPGALAVVEPAKNQVTFVCTACGFRARVPRTYAGKTIVCPKCAAPQVVPADAPATGTFAKPLDQAKAKTVSVTPIATPALAETSALFATPAAPAPMAGPPRIATPVPARLPTPIPAHLPTPIPAPSPTPIPARFPTPRPSAPVPELRAAPASKLPEPAAVAAPIRFDLTPDVPLADGPTPAPIANAEIEGAAETPAPAPTASAPAKGGVVKRRYVVSPTPAPVAVGNKPAPMLVAAPMAASSGNRGLLTVVLLVLVALLATVVYLVMQVKELKKELNAQRTDYERKLQEAKKDTAEQETKSSLASKELGGAQVEIANLRSRLDDQMRKIAELETKLAEATAPMRAPATKMEPLPGGEPPPMGQPPVVPPPPKSEM